MSTRLDEASLAFPLRWLAATFLMFAIHNALEWVDDALADLGDDQ